VGGVVGDTVDSVTGALPAVNDTVDTVGDTVTDLLGALEDTSLLDLDVDLAAELDLAAPIAASVAANANAAVPIDAAVSANALSPDATSVGTADQDSALQQTLVGEALANSTQDSEINQGEIAEETIPPPAGGSDPLEEAASLLDLDIDLDLALDLAAPIDAAIAANANVAAPIDAAVSANILSPGSTSMAIADQDSVIVQTLQGVAHASTDQSSLIEQGELSAVGTGDSTP
jgi:hypothetical protein